MTLNDYQRHLVAGLILGCAAFFWGFGIGVSVAFAGGLAKELYDYLEHGEPDWLDWAATTFGGVISAGAISLLLLCF